MPSRPFNPPWTTITRLLLAANLIFGIAVLSILPPFEGPDETAHFSRVQSQAYPRAVSDQDRALRARISTEVFDYYRRGPMPYQWIDLEPMHVNDPLRGYINYHDFFASPPQRISSYVKDYDQSSLPAGYSPSAQLNWQYQHPALYYIAAAEILKPMIGHASLTTALLALRLFSWLLAFAGFWIGLDATARYLADTGMKDAAAITALGALYPFLMPEFFWEFARLGNDSMCLFFFGILWALLLRHLRAKGDDSFALLFGFAAGLSCLTKALMIPAVAGLLAFLAFYRFLIARKSPRHGPWWMPPLAAAGLALLVAGPFYVASHVYGGSFSGGEMQVALGHGNLWAALKSSFVLKDFLDEVLVVGEMTVWIFGSWSMLVIDIPVHKPLLFFAIVIVLSYLLAAWRRRSLLLSLPLWIMAPMFAGLLSHILITDILRNDSLTPGYYFHVAAPAFALIYGLGLEGMTEKRWLKFLTVLICVLIVAFNFFILWSYMTVFAGCAIPAGVRKTYLLNPADVLQCTGRFDTVVANLGVLAWPDIGLAAAGITFILLVIAGVRAAAAARMHKTGENPI